MWFITLTSFEAHTRAVTLPLNQYSALSPEWKVLWTDIFLKTLRLVLQNQSDAPPVIQTLLSQNQSGSSRFNTAYLQNTVDHCDEEDVKIPENLLARLTRWIENPSSFWHMLETTNEKQKCQCPITLVYNRLQASKEEHSVVRRLSVLTFHHLLKRVATTAKLKTSTEAMQDLATERICEERGVGTQERKRVRLRVKEYFKAAAVYKRVMDRSEPGIILILPDKVAPYLWERYLPRKGEVVDLMVDRLQRMAIKQQDHLAQAPRLIESLLHCVTMLIDGDKYIKSVQFLSGRLGRKRKKVDEAVTPKKQRKINPGNSENLFFRGGQGQRTVEQPTVPNLDGHVHFNPMSTELIPGKNSNIPKYKISQAPYEY
ncbi:MAG: hypothetical protein M1837_000783 [Sclerophora amabilis]|nr:MAG: hypothetical protein M1837_000783 [Sclerophora amabilis]